MNCAEFEIVLADYVDGTLTAGSRQAIEEHAANCAGCREFLQDVRAGAGFLSQAQEIAPPRELVTRIAFQAPSGRTRLPFEVQGLFSRLASNWLQPVLNPKFAMGMAMTIVSFAMLQKCTGVRVQHIQAADLSPVRIWDGVEDRVIRAKDRAVKYYENIRLVYEVETRLRQLESEQQSAQDNASESRPAQPRNGSQHSEGGHATAQGETK